MHFLFLTENENWQTVGNTFRILTNLFSSLVHQELYKDTEYRSIFYVTFSIEETMKSQNDFFPGRNADTNTEGSTLTDSQFVREKLSD